MQTLVLLLMGLALQATTGAPKAPLTAAAMLGTRIPKFDVNNQTVRDAFDELSLQPLPLSLGFEAILKPKVAGPSATSVRFTLHLRNATVQQILEGLCAQDPRYTWSTDGRTINVYPVATIADRAYLLNRIVPIIKLRNAMRPMDGLLALHRALPSSDNQVAEVGIGPGDDAYPAPWTATLRGLTVRQILNRIAEQMGPRSAWILYGSEDFRAFDFNKYGFVPEPSKPDGPSQ